MSSRISKRDSGIELARIIGCLIVIALHISLADYYNDRYDLSRSYLKCILADGVAIFWLITGCFLFTKNSYQKVLLRTAKTIAIPIALYSVFCLHFYDWISLGSSSYRFRFLAIQEYWTHLNSALALEFTIPGTEHLWYCYAYILVILMFPILQAFALWMAEDAKREKWFCAITFLLLALNDYSQNRTLTFSHHGLTAAMPAAIEILWGSIIYRHKDDFRIKKVDIRLLGLPAFILLNLVRLYIIRATDNKTVLFWYSGTGLLCGIFIVMFSTFISASMQRTSRLNTIINKVARHTFVIYLIHMPVRDVLLRNKITTQCINHLSRLGEGILFELSYTAVFTFSIFLLSLFLSIVLHFLSKQCSHLKKWVFNS